MIDISKVDFTKLNDGLIPAVIQDYLTLQVLMVGFMNKEALEITLQTKKATFWSRTRNKIWTKGETSGNFLEVIDMGLDCDNDTILIYAKANGPTCHTGKISCFEINYKPSLMCISGLIDTIKDRKNNPQEGSYTNKLFNEGVKRIAQKVGEEGVETALAAVGGDDEELTNESADLVFHLLVLLRAKEIEFSRITDILYGRVGKRRE